MLSKLKENLTLLENTTTELSTPERWTAFLDTSSRLYKYNFQDQVMIYAQKPNASACAEYDVWKEVANRHVKYGSKGIALIDNSKSTPKLRYVYDHKDTAPSKGAVKILWNVTDKNKAAVSQMLKESHGIDTALEIALQEAAKKAVQEYTERKPFAGNLPQNKLVENSVAYMLLSKCGYNAGDYFAADDFRQISDFNSIGTINAVGNAVSEIAEPLLRQIESTVKEFERGLENAKLQQNQQGRNDVHRRNNGRRTDGRGSGRNIRESTERSDDVGATDTAVLRGRTETANRDLRQGEADVSAEPQAENVSESSERVSTVQPLGGNRQGSERTAGIDDSGISEIEQRDRADESGRHDAVGGTDEQLSSESEGVNHGRTNPRINPDKTEENTEAESVQPSAFLSAEENLENVEHSEQVEPFMVINQTLRQNYNMFMLAFPQIANGTYQYMNFKNSDKKELTVSHDTTTAGHVHMEISYFGTERPGHRTHDPSFTVEVDFERRLLKPVSYYNDRTGEDVNVLSIPLELQNLTAAEKEKILDDVAVKIHQFLIDVKYQGFELEKAEVFRDEQGQPLPAEPKEQLALFLRKPYYHY